MRFEQLKKELDEGKLRRLYIFTGEEKGVLQKYLNRIGVTATYNTMDEIIPLLSANSLFESSQCVAVLSGFDEYGYQELIDLCKNTHRLVLLPEKTDERKKLYKEAMHLVVNFERFTSEQLVNYVSKILGITDYNICHTIAERCDEDVLRIEAECDKLICLGEPITLELVCSIITQSPENKLFELADSIITGQNGLALKIITELKQLKTSEIQMLIVIYNRFLAVLLIKNYFAKTDFELAKMLSISPYAVSKIRRYCDYRAIEYYTEMLKELYKTEKAIKEGRVIERVAFIHLLMSLLKK